MLPFLKNLEALELGVATVLKKRGFHPKLGGTRGGPTRQDELQGKSGLVIMTVNDGEMDMVSNFVCSCRENRINTANFWYLPVARTSYLPWNTWDLWLSITQPSPKYPHALVSVLR